MPTFPSLKTGATAQYPLERTVRFLTESVHFLDGSRQRYSLQRGGLRRWTLKLDMLDDRELSALIQFVELQGSTPFTFIDPCTGDAATKCILAGDRFEAAVRNEMTGEATLTIEEVL